MVARFEIDEFGSAISGHIKELRRMIRNRKQEIVDPSRPEHRRFDLTMRQSDKELLAFAESNTAGKRSETR